MPIAQPDGRERGVLALLGGPARQATPDSASYAARGQPGSRLTADVRKGREYWRKCPTILVGANAGASGGVPSRLRGRPTLAAHGYAQLGPRWLVQSVGYRPREKGQRGGEHDSGHGSEEQAQRRS